MERLEIVQEKLFNNQINMNRSLESKIINVLVENEQMIKLNFLEDLNT